MDLSGSLIDHLNVPVNDLGASVAFYEAALAPLGIGTVLRVPATPEAHQKAMHAFGAHHKPFFWLVERGEDSQVRYDVDTHVAFAAADRAAVDAFHRAAVDAGARSLRGPGVWPEYHAGYYGAFVADPDGINVEAVHHTWVEPR